MEVFIRHRALCSPQPRFAWGITMAIRNYLVGASIRLMQPGPGDDWTHRQSRRRSRRRGYRR